MIERRSARGAAPPVATGLSALIIAVVALVSSGCSGDDNPATSDTPGAIETTDTDTAIGVPSIESSIPTATEADPALPAEFAGSTIVKRSGFANVAPGSSITDTGSVAIDTVVVYTLADEPGDGTNYDVAVSSPEGLATLSIYDPNGVRIMNGAGRFAFDASIQGEYLIVVSGDSDSSYELTVAGTG